MIQNLFNQVCGEGRPASVQIQMLTVPACCNEVRVSRAGVFGRPTLPSGSEAATVLDPADSFVGDGGGHQPTQFWAAIVEENED